MAVPAVSAAAALLWEKEPHLTNEQVRNGCYTMRRIWEKTGDAGLGNASCRQSVKGINFFCFRRIDKN